MHRIRLANASSIALEDSSLIIILSLVCQDALEDSLLMQALSLIHLAMRMRELVLIIVLEYSFHRTAHGFVFMVALRCNLLTVSFIAVFQTVMVNADNMQIIQQIAA